MNLAEYVLALAEYCALKFWIVNCMDMISDLILLMVLSRADSSASV